MNNFYYSTLCHVCKKHKSNLKRCSSCKLLAYCSKEHQMSDWKHHKHLCKVISQTSDSCNNLKALMWSTKMKRKLEPFELQMCMFPRICAVCFTDKDLIDCSNCLCVSYCCDEHKFKDEHHLSFCDSLKLCMQIDCYLFNNNFVPNIEIRELSLSVAALPGSLNDFMKFIGYSEGENQIQYILTADLLCPFVNIVYALELSNLLKNRIFVQEDLTIHLVGAANYELCMDWLIIIEYLFHWIQNLKSIKIILIGPELNNEEEETNFTEFLCDSCKHKKATLACYKNCYDKVVNHLSKPNLVVAFNSGLHEFKENSDDTWRTSLSSLVSCRNVPFLLTAYTEEEIKKDVQRLNEAVEVLVKIRQKNAYSSLRPLRDWTCTASPIFYVNNYLAVVVKSK